MKKNPETSADQSVYRDIARGYSEIDFGGEVLYVRHISNLDFGSIQEFEKEKFEEAKDKGVFTKEQKINSLIEQDLWSRKQESKLSELKREVEHLKITIRKLILAKQKKSVQKNISKTQKELDELEKEREALVGVTCEKYAQSKANQEFLRTSIFKEKKLKNLRYENEDFYELSDEELSEVSHLYNEIIGKFSKLNLKKIAASGFFLNGIIAAKCDANSFYGKAVVELSNYQLDLFSTAIRYKSVLEHGKPPPDNYYNDIRMVVDWFELELGGKAISGRNKGKQNLDGQMVMGASAEEMKTLSDTQTGMSKDGQVVNFAREAKKTMDGHTKDAGEKQTHLSFKDMMKIHGEDK